MKQNKLKMDMFKYAECKDPSKHPWVYKKNMDDANGFQTELVDT